MEYFGFIAFCFVIMLFSDVSSVKGEVRRLKGKISSMNKSGEVDEDMEAKLEYLEQYIGKKCTFVTQSGIGGIAGQLAECKDGWIKIKVKEANYKLIKFSDIISINTNE